MIVMLVSPVLGNVLDPMKRVQPEWFTEEFLKNFKTAAIVSRIANHVLPQGLS